MWLTNRAERRFPAGPGRAGLPAYRRRADLSLVRGGGAAPRGVLRRVRRVADGGRADGAPPHPPRRADDARASPPPPPPPPYPPPPGAPNFFPPPGARPIRPTVRFGDPGGGTREASPAPPTPPAAAAAPTVMSDQDLLQSLNSVPPAVAEPD